VRVTFIVSVEQVELDVKELLFHSVMKVMSVIS
jgi:hypothetical protein